jgi:hypothetical protein
MNSPNLPLIKKSTDKRSLQSRQSVSMQPDYTPEKEDDVGQHQQISGGFGDSQQLDEATMQKIML